MTCRTCRINPVELDGGECRDCYQRRIHPGAIVEPEHLQWDFVMHRPDADDGAAAYEAAPSR